MRGSLVTVIGVTTDFTNQTTAIEAHCPITIDELDEIAAISTRPIDQQQALPHDMWDVLSSSQLALQGIHLKRSPNGNLALLMPLSRPSGHWKIGDRIFFAPRVKNPLSEEQSRLVVDIAKKATNDRFEIRIFAPAEVTNNPDILRDPEVYERLRGTRWWLKFKDGSDIALSFDELIYFSYLRALILTQLREMSEKSSVIGEGKLKKQYDADPTVIYDDKTVCQLLQAVSKPH